MNSRTIKKFTVSLITVLDYKDEYIKFKEDYRGAINKYLSDTENRVLILDVLKTDSKLHFIVAEKIEGVTPVLVYGHIFDRFGAIHNVESKVPAAIIRIAGDSITDYKLFIDKEVVGGAL